MLDRSRLKAQIAPPRRQPHLIHILAAEGIAVRATRAEAGGPCLARLPARPIAVPVDRAQMLHATTGLIGNAIAYTPDG